MTHGEDRSADHGAQTRTVWRWAFVLRTCNPPPGPANRLDIISKWLVLVRACVFPLTVTSAAVAGLLAVGADGFDPWLFGLSSIGLLIAHGANNLMNDIGDLSSSIDTQNYPRALYAPHPVLSGLISKRGIWIAAGVANLMSLAVMLYLTYERGWPIIAFALGGFFVSGGYAAPPFRLKKRGLGEPGVLIVWGPLMVGGTYYASTGSIPWEIFAASIPFALLATTVLMGKHIDKLPWDGPKNVGTLPVLLGEAKARKITLGDDGRVLRTPPAPRGRRRGASVVARRVPRAAAVQAGDGCVQQPTSAGAAEGLSGVAALVRAGRVRARASCRRAVPRRSRRRGGDPDGLAARWSPSGTGVSLPSGAGVPLFLMTRRLLRRGRLVPVLAVLCVFGVLAAPATAQTTRDRLNNTREQVSRVKSDRERLAEAFARVDDQQHQTEHQVNETKLEIEQVQGDIGGCRRSSRTACATAYRMRGIGFFQFLLQARSFRDFNLRVMSLQRQTLADEDLVLKLRKKRSELELKERSLASYAAELAKRRAEYEAAGKRIAINLQQLQALYSQLRNQVTPRGARAIVQHQPIHRRPDHLVGVVPRRCRRTS